MTLRSSSTFSPCWSAPSTAPFLCSGWYVHPFIDRWRKRGRRAYALILPVWGFFIAIAFLVLWPFRFVTLLHELVCLGARSNLCSPWLLRSIGGVQELRSRASLRPGRTGTGRHRQELVTTGHSFARAPSDLSWTSVRDSGLVRGNRIDCRCMRLAGVRCRHWFRDDRN